MKKSFIIFGILLVGATSLTSCTKKLKDDIRDLRSELNEVKDILGSSEPITAVSTFKDDNDVTRTIKDTYRFKAGNNSTQRMTKNSEDNYEIYIERFSDVEWYEGAWIEFTYNPATKAITNKRGGQYWDNPDSYYDNTRFEGDNVAGLSIDINIKNIDVNTGDISLTFTASGDDAYTNSLPYYYSPNQGKSMTTTLDFAGKLKVFTEQ